MSTNKVTFDGPNKRIIVNNGENEIDVQLDLYSAWKEWVQQGDNSKYLLAFIVIGGDEISYGVSVGRSFFLENGWRVRPYEGNHILTLTGNLYTREGAVPFVAPLGSWTILAQVVRSNLTELANFHTLPAITTNILAGDVDSNQTAGSVGEYLKQIKDAAELSLFFK